MSPLLIIYDYFSKSSSLLYIFLLTIIYIVTESAYKSKNNKNFPAFLLEYTLPATETSSSKNFDFSVQTGSYFSTTYFIV